MVETGVFLIRITLALDSVPDRSPPKAGITLKESLAAIQALPFHLITCKVVKP